MSPGLFMDELPMSFPQHHIRGSQPQIIHQVFIKQKCDKILEASGWVKQDLISCSVAQSCLTLCDPMDCSMPGFPVLHYLLEFVQSHAHLVSDAIQPSLSLSHPSPHALNLSQHQGLFQWVSSLRRVAKALELQLQHQSFQCIRRADFPQDWLVWSPFSSRDSQESSPALASVPGPSAFFMMQFSHS